MKKEKKSQMREILYLFSLKPLQNYKFNIIFLITVSIIFLFLSGIISLFLEEIKNISKILIFFGVFFVLFFLYSLIFIFMQAFENNKSKFFYGLLIFIFLNVSLVLISNLFALLGEGSRNLQTFSFFTSIAVLIYQVILNFVFVKGFFNSTFPRAFVTFLLIFIFIFCLIIVFLLLGAGASSL